jgi:hypothetical protein
MTTQIQILKNGALAQTRTLEDGSYTLGRSPSADIVLPDNAVSKTHALLTIDQDRISVTDKGSANGLFFQGRKIAEKTFDSHFEIDIKPFTLRTTAEDMPESDEAAVQKISAIRYFSINNIKVSLFLIFAVIMLLTVLIGYFPLKQKTASIARQEKLKSGILLTRYLAEMNRPFLAEEQHTQVRTSPVRMEDGVIYAFVVDARGRIIAPREKQGDYVDWTGLSGAFADAKLKVEDGKQGEKIIFYPVIQQDQIAGAAILGFAWQQTGTAAASGMGFLAILLIAILFGIGFIMAHLLARSFLSPMKSLYEAMEIAIKNGATALAYEAPYTELENLKRTFDRLLARKAAASSPEPYSQNVSSSGNPAAAPQLENQISESRKAPQPSRDNAAAAETGPFPSIRAEDRADSASKSSDGSTKDLKAPWCVIDRENYVLVRCSENFKPGLGTKDCQPGMHVIEALETDIIPAVSQLIDADDSAPQTLTIAGKTYQMKRTNTPNEKNTVMLVFEDVAQ